MGQKSRKILIFSAAILIALLSASLIIQCLAILKTTVFPEIYLHRIALALFVLSFAMMGGWYSFRLVGGLCFAFFALLLVFFVVSVTKSQVFLWFILEYCALQLFLHHVDQTYSVNISVIVSDREKLQMEHNDKTASFKSKGEAISMLFEKYSTYYNMRKLAEELAKTFSVHDIADILVRRSLDFILRGDLAVLSLYEADPKKIPIVASYSPGHAGGKTPGPRTYNVDLYDAWILKNRKQLIVLDSHQDFRFDAKSTLQSELIRSIIAVPLVQAEKVIGVLRIHAATPHTFTNDDLRLLGTIGILGASALANAILFVQTEELAIKDSLTGLFVRRHFFERLKDEHQRALVTKRPLSLLMCDLDHFKPCNDRYGHAVGDMMLIHFAQILTSATENAITGRYGGEEFVMLLPETKKSDAVAVAEGIRKKLEDTPFVVRREKIPVTVSIGVASFPDDTLDLETLVSKADQSLYDAKRGGRNRVC